MRCLQPVSRVSPVCFGTSGLRIWDGAGCVFFGALKGLFQGSGSHWDRDMWIMWLLGFKLGKIDGYCTVLFNIVPYCTLLYPPESAVYVLFMGILAKHGLPGLQPQGAQTQG